MSQFLSRVDFAELAGVSPAAMTKACRPGNSLHPACDGKRIDAAHPAALEYLSRQAGKGTPKPKKDRPAPKQPTAPQPKPTRRNKAEKIKMSMAMAVAANPSTPIAPTVANSAAQADNRPPIDQVPENIRAFLSFTLEQLVRMYGTDTAFLDWLRATKVIEDIQATRIRNAEAAGELVRRDVVKVAIIDPFDEVHRRMLSDGAKTIAKRVATMAQAGCSAEEMEKLVRDQLGSFIAPAKDKITRMLKTMKADNG